MLQQIEECCSLGAHAAVIIPPTWIIRVRRTQVHTQTNVTVKSVFKLSLRRGVVLLIQRQLHFEPCLGPQMRHKQHDAYRINCTLSLSDGVGHCSDVFKIQ